MLNSGKLSSFSTPAERLQTVLNNISNVLLTDFDSYQLLWKDAPYYYQNAQFIYGRQENVIYISIKVSPKTDNCYLELFFMKISLESINCVTIKWLIK